MLFSVKNTPNDQCLVGLFLSVKVTFYPKMPINTKS